MGGCSTKPIKKATLFFFGTAYSNHSTNKSRDFSRIFEVEVTRFVHFFSFNVALLDQDINSTILLGSKFRVAASFC